jgi:hypothetical protein
MNAYACVILLAASAQAQTRSDLIQSARIEKEAALTPQRSSKAEERFVNAENSLPFRLITGEAGGFGIGFGQITPGTGVSVGPQYRRDDLLGGRLSVGAGARVSINESYLGRFDLALPRLLDGKAFVNFSLIHRNVSEMATTVRAPTPKRPAAATTGWKTRTWSCAPASACLAIFARA